jgi:hypothetical protein
MRIKSISGVTTRDAFNIPPALIGIKPEYNVTGHRRLGAVMALIIARRRVPTVPAISEGRKVSESDRVRSNPKNRK